MVPEDLYVDYKHELQRLAGGYELPRGEMLQWLKDFQSEPCISYRLTYDPTDKEVAGFVIMSFSPQCDPECDIFIQDLYVRPESRRKGLATELMRKTFDMYNVKRACLYVMDANMTAKAFWRELFGDEPIRKDPWVDGYLMVYDINKD